MATRSTALIFDFGNVVAFFDYNRAGAVLGQPLGLTGEEFMEHARSRGFTPLLARFESGKMTAEEFGAELCSLVGLDMAHGDFAAAFADIFTLNEPVAALLPELRREGYALVLGSNTNALHAGHFRSQFEQALSHLDAMVLSHEVGAIKPSRDFYLACARAAKTDPADCVFIDDLPENVDGARRAGLQALLFRDIDELRRDLRGLGIAISPG